MADSSDDGEMAKAITWAQCTLGANFSRHPPEEILRLYKEAMHTQAINNLKRQPDAPRNGPSEPN